VKNILSFKLFENEYLKGINPFKKDIKYPSGLKFANKEEAQKSVSRLKGMLENEEIELKGQRAEQYKFPRPAIKEAMQVWKTFLWELKKKEDLGS
jgi:hypothetical protein